jgi:hypothetical protein
MPSPFKSVPGEKKKAFSPEELFAQLRGRHSSIRGLLAQQADVVREYAAKYVESPNVALELPTGAGKTLIGLLLAEWRRQTRSERALYLCPTVQLVHQVAEKARLYGIECVAFVGSKAKFAPKDVQDFNSGKKVGIAPYSRVFNVSPGLVDPNFIVVDDAHAAEQYIAGMWSLNLTDDNEDIRNGALDVLKAYLPSTFVSRLDQAGSAVQARSIEMVPAHMMPDLAKPLREYLDARLRDGPADLTFPWGTLRAHLASCNVFVSADEILIRPYIPPSLTHKPFEVASQRLFLSATIGPPGSLERMTGVPAITRMPTPPLMRSGGTGRRFFLFPAAIVPSGEAVKWALGRAEHQGRALVVCRDHSTRKAIARSLKTNFGMKTLTAKDVEASLAPFVESTNTALVVATRFDGLDLPQDACRLTILAGAPNAVNLQEWFMLTRLGMADLLQDRMVTRFMQASGRCTRGETDYSLVIPTGQDLLDFCVRKENRALMHEAIAAEVGFGLEQSTDGSLATLDAMADAFFAQDEDWKAVDSKIQEFATPKEQPSAEAMTVITKNAKREVEFAYLLWAGPDYHKAAELSQAIVDSANASGLSLYRAWWAYQTGACYLALSRTESKGENLLKAEKFFNVARGAAGLASWYSQLPHVGKAVVDVSGEEESAALGRQVDNLLGILRELGLNGPAFEADVSDTLALLSSDETDEFERGLRRAGEYLGWSASRPGAPGSPDSVWEIQGRPGLVFEAKSGKEANNPISKADCTQAQGHKGWVKTHKDWNAHDCRVVLISKNASLHQTAVPHISDLYHANLATLTQEVEAAVIVLRELRAKVTDLDGQASREKALSLIRAAQLSPGQVSGRLTSLRLEKLVLAK